MNSQPSNQKQIPYQSLWLSGYALLYAVFHIFPVFFRYDIKNGFRLGDLLDLFTPFIIVFTVYKLYSILVTSAGDGTAQKTRLLPKIILIFGTILFIEGHGMHLSANALGRLIKPSAAPVLYSLDYFFDETLGHLLWDGGIAIISIGLVVLSFQVSVGSVTRIQIFPIALGGLIYGLTFFINAIEGQTVPLTLPLAVLIPVFILLKAGKKRIKLRTAPLPLFFLIAYFFSLSLFIGWRLWQGGFPEFSELGWI